MPSPISGSFPTRGWAGGEYGPYRQSERATIYLSYAREMLRSGKAYLCFATSEELAETRTRQQQLKRPTGYYGEWAIWRDADVAAVREQLENGTPYVVRFRSPGRTGGRSSFIDAIRGELSMEDNYNDVVILKSSAAVQLPTYHFAHAVDDHLMRCNLVIRGEEWLSSTALHLQLFEALGFEPPTYAHIALLMKQIPGGKRKLSKRKDPEADVDFYIRSGYPADAVLYYLRGLANGRLAETPLPEALAAPISLAECGGAGPLVDLVKLEDISADHIATLSGPEIYAAVTAWAAEFDPELQRVIEAHPEQTLAALAVERDGVDNPRKDLRKWSDFRPAYGFFFAELFTPVVADDAQLGGLPADLVRSFAGDFVASYQDLDDPVQWFQQIRDLADKFGFAGNAKEYKKNPDAYPGFDPGGVPVDPSRIDRFDEEPRPVPDRARPGPRRGDPADQQPYRLTHAAQSSPCSIRSRARSSIDANGPTAKFNSGDSTPACGRVGAMASAACTAAVSRLDSSSSSCFSSFGKLVLLLVQGMVEHRIAQLGQLFDEFALR